MKHFVLAICLLVAAASDLIADENHRYIVDKVEVQSGVVIYDVPSTNRVVARARLTKVANPNANTKLDVWFEIDDALDYGKLKLSVFMTAVATGKRVEISTNQTMGWMNWAIDTSWTDPVEEYCYLVALTEIPN